MTADLIHEDLKPVASAAFSHCGLYGFVNIPVDKT